MKLSKTARRMVERALLNQGLLRTSRDPKDHEAWGLIATSKAVQETQRKMAQRERKLQAIKSRAAANQAKGG